MNVLESIKDWVAAGKWRMKAVGWLIVLFVASIFVILEVKFHAFALMDAADHVIKSDTRTTTMEPDVHRRSAA